MTGNYSRNGHQNTNEVNSKKMSICYIFKRYLNAIVVKYECVATIIPRSLNKQTNSLYFVHQQTDNVISKAQIVVHQKIRK